MTANDEAQRIIDAANASELPAPHSFNSRCECAMCWDLSTEYRDDAAGEQE